MRKINFFGFLFLTGVLTFAVSCKKEDLQNEPANAGVATISGNVKANLDETIVNLQNVPEGTGITFRIEGEDLVRNPDEDYDYEDVVVKTTVDATGSYSASLPAVKESISVKVIFDDFEYDATVLVTNDQGFQEEVTQRRTFKLETTTISIIEGQVIVEDFDYGNASDEGTVPTGILRGKVEAQFRDNVGKASGISVQNQGTGYTSDSGVDVIGGTGTGLQVSYTAVAGEIIAVSVDEAGTGYTIGDIVTINEGDENATLKITNVVPQNEGIPMGVVLTFTTNDNTFKVTTDANGEYFIKVPSNEGTINISGLDFESSSTYWNASTGDYEAGDKVYSANGTSTSIAEGAIIDLDLTYGRN